MSIEDSPYRSRIIDSDTYSQEITDLVRSGVGSGSFTFYEPPSKLLRQDIINAGNNFILNKVFSRVPIPAKPSKKRILTEYWLVPNTDGVYFTDYEDLRSTKLRYLSYNSKSGFYDHTNQHT